MVFVKDLTDIQDFTNHSDQKMFEGDMQILTSLGRSTL